MRQVREYFYGPRGDLSPHSQTVRWDELRLYAVGGGPRAPTSALPIGARFARHTKGAFSAPLLGMLGSMLLHALSWVFLSTGPQACREVYNTL